MNHFIENPDRIHVRINNSLAYLRKQLYIYKPEKKIKEIVWEEAKDYNAVMPTFLLDDTALQVLMDDLWSCGIRPTEGNGNAGQLTATVHHLNDMRRIVEKFAKVELGKDM